MIAVGMAADDTDVIGTFIDHAAYVGDEICHSGPRGVTCPEEEHVQEEDSVVVEEVSEGELSELKRDVRVEGDPPDVGYTIDVCNYALEGQVPCWIDDVGEFHLGYGDVPAFYFWRGRVVGEEFHVDGVCIVWFC